MYRCVWRKTDDVITIVQIVIFMIIDLDLICGLDFLAYINFLALQHQINTLV